MSYLIIPKVKELKLIAMYLYISDIYKRELMYACSRFSNNSDPEFTDAEVMTIYLYAMHIEQRFRVKQIYDYASDHLRSWFPLLPSYVAFNTRLNRLGEAFKLLSANIINEFAPSDSIGGISLLDSMPIITWLQRTISTSLSKHGVELKTDFSSVIKFIMILYIFMIWLIL